MNTGSDSGLFICVIELLFPAKLKFEIAFDCEIGGLYYNNITMEQHIHQCRKTAVLSCHIFLLNSGVEKNAQHLNTDYNFDHHMSLSKSKCWYSNNCLHFLKRAVPLS